MFFVSIKTSYKNKMLILAVGIGIVFCIIVFICYSYKQINGQNTHPKYTKYLKGNMGENQ